jgi:hypothetical protein
MAAPARVLTLPSTRTRSRDDLVDTLTAILTRPAKGFFELPKHCQCRECKAIRSAPYRCAACGFDGVPLVEPCECQETRLGAIAWIPKTIAEIEAGDESSGYGISSLPHLRAELAEMLSRPDGKCRASAKAASRKRRGLQCGHGMTWCPTCASMDGSATPNVEVDTLVELLRDLRSAMRTHDHSH